MKIAQYLRESPWGDVTPQTLAKGMGGRETAVVQIAEHLSDMGHEVITYAPCTKTIKEDKFNGGSSTYTSPENIVGGVTVTRPDLLITWEEPRLAHMDDIREACDAIVMGMQVAHVVPDEVAKASLSKLDRVVCLSDYAANVLANDNKKFLERSNISIIPNCVDINLFPSERPKKADKPTAIYSSSPDRGLQNLVHSWPLVKEILPDAELHICYGVENWFKHALWNHSRDGQHALEIRDFLGFDNNLQQTRKAYDGVIYHGKVGQKEIRSLMAASHILAFPCETQSPTETGCITVVEALASYTHPVLGKADCLEPDYSEVATFIDLPVDHTEYAELLVKGFHNELPNQEIKINSGRKLAEERTWSNAAAKYVELAQEIIDAKALVV